MGHCITGNVRPISGRDAPDALRHTGSIAGRAVSSAPTKLKPSSSQPVTPPTMILTGRFRRARRIAARAAPLQ